MANKPRNLTVKQKKFVKEYVATDGNGQKAAKAAYDVKSDSVARTVASENLTKPNIKEAIEAALIQHGITIEAATKPIADGLYAFKDDDQPDHSVRLKASGMALKLLGADQKADSPTTGNTFLINNANFNAGKYVDK